MGVDFVADFAGEEGEEGVGAGLVLCFHFGGSRVGGIRA